MFLERLDISTFTALRNWPPWPDIRYIYEHSFPLYTAHIKAQTFYQVPLGLEQKFGCLSRVTVSFNLGSSDFSDVSRTRFVGTADGVLKWWWESKNQFIDGSLDLHQSEVRNEPLHEIKNLVEKWCLYFLNIDINVIK